MARKNGDPQGKGAAARSSFRPQAEFVRFVLDEEQKKQIKLSDYPMEQFEEDLEGLIQAGYKVTFRWDDYGNCCGCWLIAPDKDHDNSGLILAGRGSTCVKALKQAMYVHEMFFKGIWPHTTAYEQLRIDD